MRWDIDRVRNERKRRGLSQAAFAKELGVGSATVARWERPDNPAVPQEATAELVMDWVRESEGTGSADDPPPPDFEGLVWDPALFRAERKRRDMTQSEVADALSVSQATIIRWEAGQSEPRTATLREIARWMEEDLKPREADDKDSYKRRLLHYIADASADIANAQRRLSSAQRLLADMIAEAD